LKDLKSRKPVRYLVDINGCWIWQLSLYPDGYGKISVNGKTTYAHIVYYEGEHGPIPDGLVLDHKCRVRMCVNPDHLEPVTDAENIRRAITTRLTIEIVRRMRREYAETTVTHAALAEKYGVSDSHIGNILSFRKWREDICPLGARNVGLGPTSAEYLQGSGTSAGKTFQSVKPLAQQFGSFAKKASGS
jgi:hypothetical protein